MDKSRKPLVIGNLKMHGSLQSNQALLGAIKAGYHYGSQLDSALCLPFVYLYQARELLQGSAIAWGAQDLSVHTQGAHTGEIAAAMLQEFACTWVLCGHSERRTAFAETNAAVAAKASAALQAGLGPVVCVGETLAQREAGQTAAVLAEQLQPVLALGAPALGRLVIAYEPVWAIGTGQAATPAQAQQAHSFIRALLAQHGARATRILYGGSVNAENAAALFAGADIDGALVGGAALCAASFLGILQAASDAAMG